MTRVGPEYFVVQVDRGIVEPWLRSMGWSYGGVLGQDLWKDWKKGQYYSIDNAVELEMIRGTR